MRAGDALLMQFYEDSDYLRTAFGHDLSPQDWEAVGRIGTLGINMLYNMPTLGKVYSNSLLGVMKSELADEKRILTFICGHDTNIVTFIPALGVEDYELPNTLTKKSPIGVKFVIEKRLGQDGKEYAALYLVYMSTEQILRRESLTLDNPPVIVPLRLKGLSANEDGLYLFSDVQNRFAEAIADGNKFLK